MSKATTPRHWIANDGPSGEPVRKYDLEAYLHLVDDLEARVERIEAWMKGRVARETPRRAPAPASPASVPYPENCVCSHHAPAECREMAILQARRLGQPVPAEGRCDCKCHSMRPSPWDWRGGEN